MKGGRKQHPAKHPKNRCDLHNGKGEKALYKIARHRRKKGQDIFAAAKAFHSLCKQRDTEPEITYQTENSVCDENLQKFVMGGVENGVS